MKLLSKRTQRRLLNIENYKIKSKKNGSRGEEKQKQKWNKGKNMQNKNKKSFQILISGSSRTKKI